MRLISLLLVLSTLPASNLVTNAGFETLTSTANSINGIGVAPGWTSAGGSPDYFTSATLVSFGRADFQTAFEGNGLAGILNSPIVTGGSTNAQFEYLQTELLSELVAGETYRLSMMVAHADRSRRRAPDLGMHLSTNTAFNQPTGVSFLPITLTPTLNNPFGGLITSRDWILFETLYTATGGERYLTIGNFLQNPGNEIPPSPVGFSYGTGFYLIDNVSVESASAVPEPTTLATAAGSLLLVALRTRIARGRRLR